MYILREGRSGRIYEELHIYVIAIICLVRKVGLFCSIYIFV